MLSESFERPTWDEYFMLQAELAKLRSNCLTRQVGAVIVRDHRQISMGYNAIMHCAILGIEAGNKDTVLYSTFVPCLECSKMAITIGIKRIICLDKYPETDYNLLNQAGVKIEQLEKNKIQYWSKSLQNL